MSDASYRKSVHGAQICAASLLAGGVIVFSALMSHADDHSTGPHGINSQSLGLSGKGVGVGQIEAYRPGKLCFDCGDFAGQKALCNPSCTTSVRLSTAFDVSKAFTVDGAPNPDHCDPIAPIYWPHATAVGSVMLADTDQFGGILKGVCANAALYSATIIGSPPGYVWAAPNMVLAAQAVASQQTVAVNASLYDPSGGAPMNGASLTTLGLDWLTRRHNRLFVVARGNGQSVGPPADMYNAMVVSATQLDGLQPAGKFTIAAPFNAIANADGGTRRVTDILAPGADQALAGIDNPFGTVTLYADEGTSFAAPHVTGAVALLHEYANNESWGNTAKRHEVMKAVLMNSADKVKGEGEDFTRHLCMEKTIVKSDGTTNWFDSDAFGPHTAHPVDDHLGVGQLNVKRAIKQFSAGQQIPGNVNLIGWDYQRGGSGQRYVLKDPLEKDSYISITLAWSRHVNCTGCVDNNYVEGATFNAPPMTNLDLYLLKKGETDINKAVCSSKTTIYSVEHIFCKIEDAGEYEIWVRRQGTDGTAFQMYGLAWWAVRDPGDCPADLNGDGVVDHEDMAILVAAMGCDDCCGHQADLNRDGKVDEEDLVILCMSLGPCNGACCIDDSCAIVTKSECHDAQGFYNGNGTTREPDPCVGACCIGDTCAILTEMECAKAKGTFLGLRTGCDPDPCCTGACCAPPAGGNCHITTEFDCLDNGFEWKGCGTVCVLQDGGPGDYDVPPVYCGVGDDVPDFPEDDGPPQQCPPPWECEEDCPMVAILHFDLESHVELMYAGSFPHYWGGRLKGSIELPMAPRWCSWSGWEPGMSIPAVDFVWTDTYCIGGTFMPDIGTIPYATVEASVSCQPNPPGFPWPQWRYSFKVTGAQPCHNPWVSALLVGQSCIVTRYRPVNGCPKSTTIEVSCPWQSSNLSGLVSGKIAFEFP